MESASLSITRVHILRVDPGEDVSASLRALCEAEGIRQAVILGGYGTLAASHLHWVAHNRIPTDNVFARTAGGIEILAMNGLVVGGDPHVHITLSTPDGAYGGHLEPGCIAYVLCEVFLAEVAGADLKRTPTWVSVPGMGDGEIPRLTFERQDE